MSEDRRTAFERAGARQEQRNWVREFWSFARQNKKWWLIPLLLVLLIFGVLIFFSGTGLAPFIYTLF